MALQIGTDAILLLAEATDAAIAKAERLMVAAAELSQQKTDAATLHNREYFVERSRQLRKAAEELRRFRSMTMKEYWGVWDAEKSHS